MAAGGGGGNPEGFDGGGGGAACGLTGAAGCCGLASSLASDGAGSLPSEGVELDGGTAVVFELSSSGGGGMTGGGPVGHERVGESGLVVGTASSTFRVAPSSWT